MPATFGALIVQCIVIMMFTLLNFGKMMTMMMINKTD